MISKTFEITEERVKKIQLPEETSTYKPVAHGEVIDFIKENISQEGEMKLFAGNEGQIVSGVYSFGLDQADDIKGAITFMNSYNKTRKLTITAGLQVKVCSNGMFLPIGGESRYSEIHSGNIQEEWRDGILQRIKDSDTMVKDHIEIKRIMENIKLSKDGMRQELARLAFDRNDIDLSTYQYRQIYNQIENPLFNYRNGETLWDFYNHCTYAIRDAKPINVHKQHKDLGNHFIKTFNLN